MTSCQQIICRATVLVLVCLIVDSYARPMTEAMDVDSAPATVLRSRHIDMHARTAAHKRHAEIRLSSEMSRRMEELRRIQLLNNLMAGLEPNQVISVKNGPRMNFHGRTGPRTSRSNNGQVFPTTHSQRQHINPELLNRLNGQNIPSGVKLRTISNAESTTPANTAHQYRSYIKRAHDSFELARTCQDMQAMVARNNLRLRVKCKPSVASTRRSTPPQFRIREK